MHSLEIGFIFLLALLLMLIFAQIGSANRNAIVGVGLMQMVTMMIMISMVFFVQEQRQINFSNLLQVVSLSFFITFILSYLMIRQNFIRASAWQRNLAERIGQMLAPVLNTLFIDAKGNVDLSIPTGGQDQHSRSDGPRLLNGEPV